MAITKTATNLTALKINYLTQEQYEDALDNNEINENELYCTPANLLIDMFYPVGSYYETSDISFDPNTIWGGTWVLETEGQVHISAGSNYVIAGALTNTTDGGASSVTLDTTQIPAHTHGSKSLTGGFHARHYSGNNQLVFSPDGIVGITKTSGTIAQLNIGGTGSNGGWEAVTINATHTHDSVGGGMAHENMSPYIVVNRWHRTA